MLKEINLLYEEKPKDLENIPIMILKKHKKTLRQNKSL